MKPNSEQSPPGSSAESQRWAERVSRLEPSPVREILKVIEQPGMISFAGGLPASDSFPDISIDKIDHSQLQYGPTEGDLALREHIAKELRARSLKVSADQILVLSGSQQGIDLVAKAFVEKGTRVAVEAPSYLAALQVFSLFGAEYVSFTPDSIAELGFRSDLALAYAVPTFQNPTGHCYSTAQRHALASACDASGTVLFEDDPYRDLCFDPCDRQPVCSMLEKSLWIYQSSFSKMLAPGLRLGYLACSAELYPTLVWLKQAADLHSNRLSQHIVLSQLLRDDAAARLTQINSAYKQRRDTFERLLQTYFSELASWQIPQGGLFFWLSLKSQHSVNTTAMLEQALRQNVAFMPGKPFFPENQQAPACIRLNFSHASEAQAEAGLRVLAQLVKEAIS